MFGSRPGGQTPDGHAGRRHLAAGDVQVRCLATGGADAAALDAGLAILSAEERACAARFRFDHDRREYVLAHALVRRSLSEYADVAPAAWRFENEPGGKPRIAGAHADLSRLASNLAFNLAHARGLVACAIAPEADVGVDVECLDRPVQLRDMTRRWFASEEATELDRLDPPGQTLRFFELWTLKEAFIKATGRGLSQPVHLCRFDLGTPGAIAFTPPPGADAADFQFALFAPTPRHRLALAVRRVGDRDWRITARSVDAAQSSVADLGVLRASTVHSGD